MGIKNAFKISEYTPKKDEMILNHEESVTFIQDEYEKIVLYYELNETREIIIELFFNDDDQLIFEGHENGLDLMEDYYDEYLYSIEASEFEKLFSHFQVPNNDKLFLLNEIKKSFGVRNAFTLFGDFLRANEIEFTDYIWE